MFDGNLKNLNRTEMIKKVIDELWNRGVDSYHKLNSFFYVLSLVVNKQS